MNATIENKNEVTPPLTAMIAAHRFAADLTPAHLQKLAEAAMCKHFEPGEIIFREGEPANRFYLICQGKIALESSFDGESAPLIQLLEAGDVLGWSWLFPPYSWQFGARAIEPTNAIFFYGTRLRALCDEDPDFGYEMMKRVAAVMVQRLQTTRGQLLQLQQESNCVRLLYPLDRGCNYNKRQADGICPSKEIP